MPRPTSYLGFDRSDVATSLLSRTSNIVFAHLCSHELVCKWLMTVPICNFEWVREMTQNTARCLARYYPKATFCGLPSTLRRTIRCPSIHRQAMASGHRLWGHNPPVMPFAAAYPPRFQYPLSGDRCTLRKISSRCHYIGINVLFAI